jgi:cobalt-zinc-cadmium efflux system membrane fusion protein
MVRIDPEMLRDLRITTTMVESREGSEGVSVLGEVGVNEEAYAEVGPPVEARVIRLLAAAGDAVRQGQPLVELQSLELGRTRASYLTAKARAEVTAQALERKRGLAAERIVPVREVQEAEAEAKAALAELQAASAALQAMGVGSGEEPPPGTDASRFILRSPTAGTIIAREVARGQVVDPSKPLFRIADLSRLWLTVHAFERDAVRVSPGTQARVTFPALPGRDFSGTVTLVGRQVDVSSRTIPVRVEIANEEDLLRPGMSATAWLSVGDGGERIVSVPSACLQRMQNGWYVFLPKEEGLFEMRQVGRGRDLSGEVEILSGLKPGESVVIEGAFLLKAEAEKSRGEGEHPEH